MNEEAWNFLAITFLARQISPDNSSFPLFLFLETGSAEEISSWTGEKALSVFHKERSTSSPPYANVSSSED
jgi:hypothetical protein